MSTQKSGLAKTASTETVPDAYADAYSVFLYARFRQPKGIVSGTEFEYIQYAVYY